jgi:hypothetical protein
MHPSGEANVVELFALQCIFDAADCILNLAPLGTRQWPWNGTIALFRKTQTCTCQGASEPWQELRVDLRVVALYCP